MVIVAVYLPAAAKAPGVSFLDIYRLQFKVDSEAVGDDQSERG